MDNVGNSVQNGFNSFVDYLPQLLLGIVLIIVAWIVATLVGKAVSKGLKAIGIGKYFQKWGATKTEEQSHALIDTLSKVAYYLVWVLFLPGIFSTFGLDSIGQPIMNMIDTVLAFIPNIIAAGIVLVLGLFAAKLVKNLVYNVAIAANIDKHLAKLTGGDTNDGRS
ncbi:mechanosensitive ion channel family protein [Marinilactibacillus sp. 15R]|uniref:mechanosensitive ion channel family protein n=1 Tax=Marinilactibacillus sp. 15R TaxID=1911586 RepID=UPI000A8C1F34|nr:hypothetical protein [Marinilactibacillus sp. 15R]